MRMTLNIDYERLSRDDRDQFKGKLKETFAKSAEGVNQNGFRYVEVGFQHDCMMVYAGGLKNGASWVASIKNPASNDAQKLLEGIVEAANSLPGFKVAASGKVVEVNIP